MPSRWSFYQCSIMVEKPDGTYVRCRSMDVQRYLHPDGHYFWMCEDCAKTEWENKLTPENCNARN